MKPIVQVNAKAIKEQVRSKESDRKKLSFYLSGSLYEAFKEACDDLPASQILEALMQAFVDGVRKKTK